MQFWCFSKINDLFLHITEELLQDENQANEIISWDISASGLTLNLHLPAQKLRTNMTDRKSMYTWELQLRSKANTCLHASRSLRKTWSLHSYNLTVERALTIQACCPQVFKTYSEAIGSGRLTFPSFQSWKRLSRAHEVVGNEGKGGRRMQPQFPLDSRLYEVWTWKNTV